MHFAEGEMLLTVPHTNTTVAVNGRLRVYDEHIAKMFEVTHVWCQAQEVSPGIIWHYQAGNGSIDMGSFDVSCRLAWKVTTAYGLGQPETMLISRYAGEGYPNEAEEWRIPSLNIVGSKVDRWLDFVQNFQPIE